MTTHQSPSEAVTALPRVSEYLTTIRIETTAQTYRYMLGSFAIYLSSVKQVKADQIETWRDDAVMKFYQWMIRKEYKDATINASIAALKKYLTWLESQDILPFRLDKAMNRYRAVRSRVHFGIRHADPSVPKIVTYYDSIPLPSADEKHGQIKRLDILRARAIVHTLYASAGRVSEITSLTRDALRDGHLSECLITGKGNKDRMLLLTKEAQYAIAAYCRERDRIGDRFPSLFISHGRGYGNPIGRGTVWAIVKQAAAVLGIKGFAAPHAFRHYRAQQLLDEGMPLETLQALLGHADINLTRRVYAPNTSLAKIRSQLEHFGLDASEASERVQNLP